MFLEFIPCFTNFISDTVLISLLFSLQPVLLATALDGQCTCGRLQPLPIIDTAECSVTQRCDIKTRYRNIDGSCSNLLHTSWGKANQPFTRVLPALYHNGRASLRRSVVGFPLPEVRNLSKIFMSDHEVPDMYNTLNVMQWGQFLAHDITHVLPDKGDANKGCCTDNKMPSADSQCKSCIPIKVSPFDPFYSQFGVTCLDFTRSSPTSEGACYKYPREQVNILTPVIDASMVYGSDIRTARKLRKLVDGKLKQSTLSDERVFPPTAKDPKIPCDEDADVCYTAGDDRINVNPGNTIFHILLHRLHNNYLTTELKQLNPHWNDETLYQEARKIVGAFVQHVTYKHWLPVILGAEFMKDKGLTSDQCYYCCSNDHDPTVNPSTLAEFASAIYRTFHSLVPGTHVFLGKSYTADSFVNLHDVFLNPAYLENPGTLDMAMRGLAVQPQDAMDHKVTESLRSLLFKGKKPFGGDLESMDILRGRETGLPPYNRVREICGIKKAKDFQDLLDVMSQEAVNILKSHYLSVDDVDLYVGAIMEKLIPGTLVGPTSQCIVGEQFYNYMYGDRFYYENCGKPWSFTKDQLQSIYRTSVAWLFCTFGDDFDVVQYDTFRIPTYSNPLRPCNNIPQLDLTPWIDVPEYVEE